MKHLSFVVICAALVAAQSAQAKDLGQVGTVYEIAERDVLQDITATLKKRQASGEMAKFQKEYAQRSLNTLEHPKAVAGLSTTFRQKSFWFDPTVVVEENIVDETGRILVPAGTRKNPLDHVSFTRKWLFIDGEDERQVKMARSAVEAMGDSVRVILTSGAPLELGRRWKWRVYFDQQGVLVERFGIAHVPAWVEQDGKRLRITEVPPKS